MGLLEEHGREVVDGTAVEVFEVFDYVPLGHIGYDGKIHKTVIHCGIWGLLEAAAVILSNSYRGGEDHTVIVLGAIYLYAELLRFELKECLYSTADVEVFACLAFVSEIVILEVYCGVKAQARNICHISGVTDPCLIKLHPCNILNDCALLNQ